MTQVNDVAPAMIEETGMIPSDEAIGSAGLANLFNANSKAWEGRRSSKCCSHVCYFWIYYWAESSHVQRPTSDLKTNKLLEPEVLSSYLSLRNHDCGS